MLEDREAVAIREQFLAEVELDAALEDVRAGSGRELESRESGGRPDFCSVRSSCALAVAVFGPWRIEPDGLPLVGVNDFDTLRFEVKFPIVEDERRTPQISKLSHGDLITSLPWNRSSLSTSLRGTPPTLPPPTTTQSLKPIPRGGRKSTSCGTSPDEYRFFSAAQMVKHYLGLIAPASWRARCANSL